MLLKKQDPELFAIIQRENERQSSCISLIASENYASRAVMEVQGTSLTNKYAEGYPGKRYYGGCQHVDEAENLAIERAKQLFSAKYVNVQPHSGSQANQAVFLALLKPHQKILGMSLNDGGHLTHGSPVNMSGMWFQALHYGVDKKSGYIDYHRVKDIAHKHRPSLIIAGFSCYSRNVDFQTFREIADDVGAFLLVDMAHIAGLVAGNVSPNPLPHAHVVTATTHKTLRGPRGGLIMSNDANIHKKIQKALFPGLQGGPLMHVIAAKALAFHEAQQPTFKTYAQNVVKHARILSDVLSEHFKVVSGGTDNHIVSLDLRPHPINGREAEHFLQKVGLICNKNTVPNDTGTPFAPSGIRIGTAAATTRGLQEEDFRNIGMLIQKILLDKDDPSHQKKCQECSHLIKDICHNYPLAPALSLYG